VPPAPRPLYRRAACVCYRGARTGVERVKKATPSHNKTVHERILRRKNREKLLIYAQPPWLIGRQFNITQEELEQLLIEWGFGCVGTLEDIDTGVFCQYLERIRDYDYALDKHYSLWLRGRV